MIQSLQKHRSFYFSYQLDLTKRMQQTIQEALTPSLSREIEAMFPNSVNYVSQFAFNHKLLHPYRDSQFAPFRTPCIFGFVNIKKARQVTFALISRRDSRRPGRRFITRGLDSEGAAANFTETEHLVIVEKGGATQLVAHVQIRGSIPLIWQMKPTMQWSPAVEINPKHALSLEAAQLHVKETSQQYRKQYFVNLIDKKGSQHRIGLKMGELLGQLRDESVQYTWFDFHGECKNMKWENLSRLLETVQAELTAFGHFSCVLQTGMHQRRELTAETCTVKSLQSGVMRTNCMDCLDRTNVVQSVFSRKVLH